MADQSTFLTEAILTIQNEVQMALDYIETVSTQDFTELGAAPSLLTVDNIRIKIPLALQMQEETYPVPEDKVEPQLFMANLKSAPINKLKENLYNRKGLLLSASSGAGRYCKIKILTSPSAGVAQSSTDTGSAPAQPINGEIEINFTRIPRGVENSVTEQLESKPAENSPTADSAILVPDVLGLNLEQAASLLKSQGWKYIPNAAAEKDIQAVKGAQPGQVLRQEPVPGVKADKSKTVLRFWVALSNLPVAAVEGIGTAISGRLGKIGITTVGQLTLIQPAELAKTLKISEIRARQFVDMANLMSGLTLTGLSDNIVELLVKGARIHSVDELAEANASELFQACKTALETKLVLAPAKFRLTEKAVAGWIDTAKTALAK